MIFGHSNPISTIEILPKKLDRDAKLNNNPSIVFTISLVSDYLIFIHQLDFPEQVYSLDTGADWHVIFELTDIS